MQVSQYPRNADGTPMDLLVGVLTDDTGNGGARLLNQPIGPDKAPIDAVGLVTVDKDGNLIVPPLAGAVLGIKTFALGSSIAIGTANNFVQTTGYNTAGDGGSAFYVFDAAVNAAYVTANPRTSFISTNGRGFRLAPNQRLTFEMFGAVADDVAQAANNTAAFNAAFVFLPRAGTVFPPKLHLGYGAYHVSATLEPPQNVHIEGQGTGEVPQDAGKNLSRLIAPTDTTVFRVRFRSTGAAGNVATADGSAYGTILRGICFEQETMGTNLNAHAVDIRGAVFIDQCMFTSIAGDGFHVEAFTGGGARFGIADDWTVMNTTAHVVGGNGGFIVGNDANVGSTYHFHSHNAGGCGLLDNSYLGCHHYNLHCTGYGNKGVHRAGIQYQLIVNDPVTAAATVPGTNSAVWWPLRAGGVNAQFPEFNAADTDQMRLKLPFYIATAFSSVHGGYMEGGAVLAHGAAPIFGGLWSVTPTTPFVGARSDGSISMPSGLGYYAPSSLINTAAVGLYESLIFGTKDFQTNDPTRRRSLIEGRVGSDGEVSFGLRWNDQKDLEWRYLNNKNVFKLTMIGTTSTLGRATAQPHYIGFLDMFLQDPADSTTGRIVGMRSASPATAEPTTYHAKGEIYINNNPNTGSAFGWRCTTAGTPGTFETLTISTGGISDGDKGDVVVSGSGTVLTVESSNGGFHVGGGDLYFHSGGPGGSQQGLIYFSSGEALYRANAGVHHFQDGVGSANYADISGTGVVSSRAILSSGPDRTSLASGIGYTTGAGGAVTQATNKATAVTLNKWAGKITMNAAALAANTAVSFQLNSNNITVDDAIILNISGGVAANGSYIATVDDINNGNAIITLRNMTAGSLSEAVELNVVILRGVQS